MKFAVKALVMGLSANAVRVAQKTESKSKYYPYMGDLAADYDVAAVDAYDWHDYYTAPTWTAPTWETPTWTAPVYDVPVEDLAPLTYTP